MPSETPVHQITDAALSSARLTIDLGAVARNWHSLRARAGGAECAAAVKADAYGLGMDQIALCLWSTGCRTFFVARPLEGSRLRGLLPPEAIIYVLDGLHGSKASFYVRHELRPVLGSVTEIEEWLAFQRDEDKAYPFALHVDTGMNRLGLTLDELDTLLGIRHRDALSKTALVMSHLACADEPDHPLNAQQLECFRSVCDRFPNVPASLANSSGIFLGTDYAFDLVRPGLALYGGNPQPGSPNPMARVVTLEARILRIRVVKAGETVGYGATWTARRHGRLAIVGAGYSDGIARALSSAPDMPAACVGVAGRRAPIVGRVSMDLLAVDISDIPEEEVQPGQMVELLGEAISLDEIAARAGTIDYEVLTRLGSRYARIWRAAN